MDGRALDAQEKCDELRAAIAAADPTSLREAARRARLALEFRATDAMIGLGEVDDALLAELAALTRAALTRAAELGDRDAACDLAELHLHTGDIDAALAALEGPARAGHAAAAARAAEIIWRTGDEARHAEALAWLDGARGDDPEGRVRYIEALYAFHGLGRPADHAAARILHEEAAVRGHADAMFELYAMNAQGLGGPEDRAAAIRWCARAAAAGNRRAMANLGAFHATGNGLPRDPARAIEWYTRAADAGHGKSAATLGIMHATGDCVDVDVAGARRWFAAADALGYDWREMAESIDLDPADYE